MKKRRLTVPRQRNAFAVLAHFRKAGSHRKSNKALRRHENQREYSSEVDI
jgi:hypothetical protein